MHNLLADLDVGSDVHVHGMEYTCFSRFRFDDRDDLVVLHDVRFELDHPASLRTFFLSELVDLVNVASPRVCPGRAYKPRHQYFKQRTIDRAPNIARPPTHVDRADPMACERRGENRLTASAQ